MKSKTDSEEPKSAMPNTEKDDPMRKNERSDSVEPK
jgi:hypothetical protein